MPTTKKLIILSTALILAGNASVMAQDADPLMSEPVVEEPAIVDAFTASDTNADGALDRDEFVAFVVMKADSGEVDYKGVKLSGEYDNYFNTKDYNADGLLTAEELKSHVDEDTLWTEPESEPEPDETN